MAHYIINLIFYTLAMVGVILIGFVIAKKSLMGVYSQTSKNKFLEIESYLALEPRKNVYVLKAGTERFLLSSSPEKIHFLTKLDNNNVPYVDNIESEETNTVVAPKFIGNNGIVIKIAEKIHEFIIKIKR